MAKKRRIRWDRVVAVFGPLFLLILLIFVRCTGGNEEPEESSPAPSVTAETGITTTSAPLSSELVTTETTVEADPVAIVPKEELLIVIDPGHGGHDGGAQDSDDDPKRFEKDDNLRLALAVRDALRVYPRVRVLMTRETDVYIKLEERCQIANTAGADFFVSLHRNSSRSGSGVEIWINNDSNGDKDNSWDKLLAEYIMELLDDVGISYNRGIKTGFRSSESNEESNNYYVNRNTNMPSCLVEMGFMSSTEDNRNFDDHLNEYAAAIARGVYELATDKGMLITDEEG